MDKKVTLAQLKEVVQEAYDQVKRIQAVRMPTISLIWPMSTKDLFGISVCLLNGQTIHVGDTDYRFGIESRIQSTYGHPALRQYGAKRNIRQDRS